MTFSENACLNEKHASSFHSAISVLENCNFPHTSYVSVSNAYVTNILFPVTIFTSDQSFAVGVQIILGFGEETDAHADAILASLFSQ